MARHFILLSALAVYRTFGHFKLTDEPKELTGLPKKLTG